MARFVRADLLFKEPLRRDLGGQVTGVAITEDRVYAACPKDEKIRIFDYELNEVGAIDLPKCQLDELAFDAKGRLWVLLPHEHQVLGLLPASPQDKITISLPEDCNPTAMAFHPDGSLWIADAGPSEQILVYDDLERKPRLLRRVGDAGGMLAGPNRGTPGDLRFYGISAMAIDRDGRLTVANGSAHSAGTLIHSYDAKLKRTSELAGLIWSDCATTDPRDESRLIGTRTLTTLVPGKAVPWRFDSFTLDPHRFPEDPRLSKNYAMQSRMIGGRLFTFGRFNYQDTPVWRSEVGSNILIPCAWFRKKDVWIDDNGNGRIEASELRPWPAGMASWGHGWSIDAKGDVYTFIDSNPSGLRHLRCTGLMVNGTLGWDVAGATFQKTPAPFTVVRRMRYDSASDTMICIGYTAEMPQGTNEHSVGGRLIARYDHWSTPERVLSWTTTPPYINSSTAGTLGEGMGVIMAIDVAGDYLFTTYIMPHAALGHGRGHIEVFSIKNGANVGWIEPPPEIGEVGWQDIEDSISATRLKDGSYRIIQEDNWYNKAPVYHWKP